VGRRIRRHVEIGVVVDDLARLSPLHRVHPHGLLEEAAEVEERDRIVARAVGPQGEIGLELDLAVGVVVDLLQDLRVRPRRRIVGRGGERLGPGLEGLEGEGRGIAHRQRGLGEGRLREACGSEGSRGGGAFEERAAVDHGLGAGW
jgi:hypothetical protein